MVVFFSLFLVGSRLLTTFTPLYQMRLGFRMSLFPAINLCQMSELSPVLLMLGVKAGDVSTNTLNIATFAFAFLAGGFHVRHAQERFHSGENRAVAETLRLPRS